MRNHWCHLSLSVALLVFVVAARASAAEAKIAGTPQGEVVDFGILTLPGEEPLKRNPDTLDGRQSMVRGAPKFAGRTSFVPAKLGANFGFSFVLSGIKETGSVELKKIVKHPRMKNTNGEEEEQYAVSETRPVRNGKVVGGAGYRLDRPEELEPGIWTFEIWYRDMKLISQSFTVYSEAAQAVADPGEAPSKFVTQVLEPTGGKILRPEGWFYAERHHGPVYDWVITREDTHGGTGPYTTGARIQVFYGVQDGTGKAAKEFIRDFVAAKKKEVVKIIKTCGPEEQDSFTRICLETEEGPYHILYSLFWGNNNFDCAVIVIAGTTKALWDTYAPVFDQMRGFELIDLKRFEK